LLTEANNAIFFDAFLELQHYYYYFITADELNLRMTTALISLGQQSLTNTLWII